MDHKEPYLYTEIGNLGQPVFELEELVMLRHSNLRLLQDEVGESGGSRDVVMSVESLQGDRTGLLLLTRGQTLYAEYDRFKGNY